MQKKTIAEIVIGASVLVGAIYVLMTQGTEVWAKVGWKTVEGHSADIAAIEAKTSAEAQEVLEFIGEFRAEWKCDEWTEELVELADERSPSADELRRIEELREILQRNECSRFAE